MLIEFRAPGKLCSCRVRWHVFNLTPLTNNRYTRVKSMIYRCALPHSTSKISYNESSGGVVVFNTKVRPKSVSNNRPLHTAQSLTSVSRNILCCIQLSLIYICGWHSRFAHTDLTRTQERKRRCSTSALLRSGASSYHRQAERESRGAIAHCEFDPPVMYAHTAAAAAAAL